MGSVILLVEDNVDIMQANRRMLEMHGYGVSSAASLAEARRELDAGQPDLAVLDIMLPDGSGLDFCGELRERRPGTPVLFLTVLGEKDDVVTGLRAGGDDYLTKPYDYDILMARIEALLRRAGRSSLPQVIGPLSVDHTSHRVYRDGKDTFLKPKEYALFLLLARNPGVFFQPEDLYRQVWAAPCCDVRTVYAHVCSLRKKLGIHGDGSLAIEQKRGRGYRLVTEREVGAE